MEGGWAGGRAGGERAGGQAGPGKGQGRDVLGRLHSKLCPWATWPQSGPHGFLSWCRFEEPHGEAPQRIH